MKIKKNNFIIKIFLFLIILGNLIVWPYLFSQEFQNRISMLLDYDFNKLLTTGNLFGRNDLTKSNSVGINLQQINNVGYSFYLGQIDYSNSPPIGDDLKNNITQIIYKADFPKRLLSNLAIIIVNTLAITPNEQIITPNGNINVPSFNPNFLTEGGEYNYNPNNFSIIYINSKKIDLLSGTLTHELGHHISRQLTNEEWAKFYQLRNIPNDAPRFLQNWYISPNEDFAEVYKNSFTNLPVKTYFGILESSHKEIIGMSGYTMDQEGPTCSNISNALRENFDKLHPKPKSVLTCNNGSCTESLANSEEFMKYSKAWNEITDHDATLQNCRINVILHQEKYPQDFQGGTPYHSKGIVDQPTKDFIKNIITRLD